MRRVWATLGTGATILALGSAGVTIAGAEPDTDYLTASSGVSGLVPTPPMGWNSWNKFGCDITEELIRQTADALVDSGMRDAGYEYVNIDDCWQSMERDENGRLQPHPERFPNGIKALADYVHERGLKLGIYSSAGTKTCAAEAPASLGYEEIDAQTFAEWEVDLLKYDNCFNEGVPALERYQAMGDALAATGRDIVYSICEWGANQPWLWGRDVGGHYWRTTGDIYDAWESVTSIIDQQVGIEHFSGPNAWNDPDMLEVGNGGMTTTEYRAHMSMWSLLNAPLIAGNDLRTMDATTLSILTDRDVIAINQDWAGEQGTKRRDDGHAEVWSKPMSDGSTAVVLLNRGETAATIAVEPEEIGLAGSPIHAIRDVWTDEVTETSDSIRATVPSHGAAMYVVREAGTGKPHPPHVNLTAETPEFNEPGQPVTVTTALYNDGRMPILNAQIDLEVPDGWTTQSSGQIGVVPPEGVGSLTWVVTPPADLRVGRTEISATGTWTGPGGSGSRTTPTNLILVEPVAPGTHHLSDVPWVHSTNGWGPIERDMSNGDIGAGDGNPLTIGGTRFAKGLGTNAASSVSYFTAGRCTALAAEVGVDDEAGDRGSVTFEIWADGTRVASSDVLTGADGPAEISADVTAADTVELRVTDGGDGITYDHADWADVQIECGNAPPSDGSTFVSDLEWTGESNGWGPVERDMSNGEQRPRDGRWITIAGVTYAKGIGVHAPSEVVVPLSGECIFTSDVGVDDEVRPGATVRFRVYADDVLVAETGVLRKGDGPTTISADVGTDTTLRLVMDDGGDSFVDDHGDWGDARVTCS